MSSSRASLRSIAVDLGADARRDRREVERGAGVGRTSAAGRRVAVGMAAPGRGEGLSPSSTATMMCPVHCSHHVHALYGMMLVDLRRLRHLIAVAEHGNFGRAAAASLHHPAGPVAEHPGVGGRGRRAALRSPPERGRAHRHGTVAAASRQSARRRRPRPRPRDPPRQGTGARRAAHRRRPVGWRRARRPGDRSPPRAASTARLRVVVAPWRELPHACATATSTSWSARWLRSSRSTSSRSSACRPTTWSSSDAPDIP